MKWTRNALIILKKQYSKRGAKYVARKTGHPASSVVIKANSLGINSALIKRWKQMEINYLLNNYPQKSLNSISRTLKRSRASVEGKARTLKIYVPPAPKWTKDEFEKLKKLWTDKKFSIDEIAAKLNKTRSSVHAQAWGRGLRRPKIWHFWTKEEVSYLKKNYKKKSPVDIAKHLGLTKNSVFHKAANMGLRLRRPKRPWTEENDNFIRLNYRKIKTREIAEKLDRSADSIIERASKLGLALKRKTKSDNIKTADSKLKAG